MTNSSFAKNATIVREALGRADIGWIDDTDDREPNLTTIGIEDEGRRWLTFIFTDDSTATVRLYSTYLFDPTNSNPARMYEALNFINYDRLLDTHIEFNPVIKRVRLRENIRATTPLINPIEFMDRFQNHLLAAKLWAEAVPEILESSLPIEQAVRETHSKLLAKRQTQAAEINEQQSAQQ